MSKPTLIDLFSGIGGFSLGLERAGYRTAAFCEISPKCRHLLKHHWPDTPCYDDVQTLTAERLRGDGIEHVDAICGGFPCQDISLAGKGAGLAGERSGLWREYARIVGELRPGVVYVENVSALLVRGMGTVLGDLAALGYDAWWDCIPASAVGAPHRRDRLWIVAYARGQQHEGFGDALRRQVAAELSGANLADTDGTGWPGRGTTRSRRQARHLPSRSGCAGGGGGLETQLSDADREGCDGRQKRDLRPTARIETPCRDDALRCGSARTAGDWWATEPDVRRVAHGVSARVDRLHGLGNAVVPEIPYRLGRAVLAAHLAHRGRRLMPRSTPAVAYREESR